MSESYEIYLECMELESRLLNKYLKEYDTILESGNSDDGVIGKIATGIVKFVKAICDKIFNMFKWIGDILFGKKVKKVQAELKENKVKDLEFSLAFYNHYVPDKEPLKISYSNKKFAPYIKYFHTSRNYDFREAVSSIGLMEECKIKLSPNIKENGDSYSIKFAKLSYSSKDSEKNMKDFIVELLLNNKFSSCNFGGMNLIKSEKNFSKLTNCLDDMFFPQVNSDDNIVNLDKACIKKAYNFIMDMDKYKGIFSSNIKAIKFTLKDIEFKNARTGVTPTKLKAIGDITMASYEVALALTMYCKDNLSKLFDCAYIILEHAAEFANESKAKMEDKNNPKNESFFYDDVLENISMSGAFDDDYNKINMWFD